MKFTIDDFDIINDIQSTGIILMPKTYSELFKIAIYDIIKDLLKKNFNTTYVQGENYTSFENEADIYIKWDEKLIYKIWISSTTYNYTTYELRTYDHYLKIKSNSPNRSYFYSNNFNI